MLDVDSASVQSHQSDSLYNLVPRDDFWALELVYIGESHSISSIIALIHSPQTILNITSISVDRPRSDFFWTTPVLWDNFQHYSSTSSLQCTWIGVYQQVKFTSFSCLTQWAPQRLNTDIIALISFTQERSMSNLRTLFFLAIGIGIIQIQTTASHVIPRPLVPTCKAMFPSSNVSPLDHPFLSV